jgi:hypothetical protein
MEIIYFTAAGIILYVAADWILKRMESAAGSREIAACAAFKISLNRGALDPCQGDRI